MCSPFLLGSVVEHLESWEAREPELVAEIRKSLYVNDLLSGKPTVAEAKELKVGAIQIFANGILMLLSWKVNNLVWKQRIPLPNSNLVHQLIKSPVCLASPGIRKLMRSVSFPEMRMPVSKRVIA